MLNVLTIQAHDVASIALTEPKIFNEGEERQFWSRDLIITNEDGQKQRIALYSCTSAEALEVINV